jgi:hypothetical protein
MNTQNYPTWLVPLEITKELKEIGFDEPCNHYVRISNDDIKLKINHSSIGLVILKRNSEYLNDDIASFVTIPTWEQVFEWFREKGLECFIEIDYQSTFEECCYYCYVITNQRGKTIDYKSYFDDYNEAREALVIELIRTYKREQYKIK